MEKSAENALKNLIDAYNLYSDKASELRLHPSRELLMRLNDSEKERLRRLFDEFNAERLKAFKDNVVAEANDFVKFYANYPLFAD